MNLFLPSLRDNSLVKGAECPGPLGLEHLAIRLANVRNSDRIGL